MNTRLLVLANVLLLVNGVCAMARGVGVVAGVFAGISVGCALLVFLLAVRR